MSDKIFADGLMFNKPHENAPEFVKGGISVKVEEFKAFLDKHKDTDGWVRLDLKKGKESGKLYFELNTWKPPAKSEGLEPEDIPF